MCDAATLAMAAKRTNLKGTHRERVVSRVRELGGNLRNGCPGLSPSQRAGIMLETPPTVSSAKRASTGKRELLRRRRPGPFDEF